MGTIEKVEPINKPAKRGIGYIDPHTLDELWFHTGTACNLACPFCLEGSRPGDNRLERITLTDVLPYINLALTLGVKQFLFTGGEPFIVKDFIPILDYASRRRPCLVLSNGTEPLIRRMDEIIPLADNPFPVSFRISLDYPDEKSHDAGRGQGNFHKALQGMRLLHQNGFALSVARQQRKGEDRDRMEKHYRTLLADNDLPENIPIVAFPDFLRPNTSATVPTITEMCMINYHAGNSRKAFMCAFSKMIVKQAGRMRVYACTLVDDDPFYDLGTSLSRSMHKRIYLRHHRCYSCFAHGASCSEMK